MKKLLVMLLVALMKHSAFIQAALSRRNHYVPDVAASQECSWIHDHRLFPGSYALQSLFRGLYKYDVDGAGLVPAMAESYRLEDGCTYTFKSGRGWPGGAMGSPLIAQYRL